MPSTNPVDYGADPCGLRNSAWAINLCLMYSGRCDFPEGTFLIGSAPGAKITSRLRFNNVATFTTATPHGLVVGELITLDGFTDSTFNGIGAAKLGFRVDSTPNPTTFTATVPGGNSVLVVEDGWINLIGGDYTSSIPLGFAGSITDPRNGQPLTFSMRDNLTFTGKGAGKTRVKFANHTSTTRGDSFGFNIQMIKCLGNYYTNGGLVSNPTKYPSMPLGATNCKNLTIEGITFDGNYVNNGPKDITIVSVERTAGINTYTTAFPAKFQVNAPPAYSPPVLPAPSNQSSYSHYIDGVVTSGSSNDGTFNGFGPLINTTSLTFQRDMRCPLIGVTRNAFNYAIYTKHPDFNFGYTVGDSITVTGFSNPAFNGSFVVAGFLSAQEVYCVNVGAATTVTSYERLTGVGYYDTAGPHGFTGGETVVITGLADPTMNGTFIVTGAPFANQFSVVNAGTDTGVIAGAGTYQLRSNIAKSWSVPDVALTPQTNAGVNSLFTVAGLNLIGENTIVQDCEFYDFGVGIADAETFVLKSFLPSTVVDRSHGTIVRRNRFGYQGRNSVQATIHAGTSEANTQCSIGGYSSMLVNVIAFARVAATNRNIYTTTERNGLRIGDSVVISGIGDITFDGTFTVDSIISETKFSVTQAGADFPDTYAAAATALMPRPLRILAADCVFEYNRIQGGPNPLTQQCPVHGITPRDTFGAEVRYNNFDGFTGTCFYVDTYPHIGTHVHHNSALNVSAFMALTVQDWYATAVQFGFGNPPSYAAWISAHKDLLIEYNDVLLTGPDSWYYQPALAPLDAVFVINNHDVNRSAYYYPTDYQIPIRPPAPLPAGASRDAAGISTFTTVSPHELQAGMEISVVGVTDGTFNGVFTVLSTPSATEFTVNNQVGPLPNTPVVSGNGFLGINDPVNFPWEIRMSARSRSAGVATYTTTKAHNMQLGYHVTLEGFSDPTFNGQFIVTGMPTTTTFQVANAGPDVATVTESGNFFRYVENVQIRCNTVRRLSGNELFINNGGKFGPSFLPGRPSRCVAPLQQTFYLDCPEGCLDIQCDPGPCKPNDYLYRI